MNTPLYICRTKENVSLDALAVKCGSSASTLNRLELGRSKNPSGSVCLKLITRYKKYGLTLNHLVNPLDYPDFVIKD